METYNGSYGGASHSARQAESEVRITVGGASRALTAVILAQGSLSTHSNAQRSGAVEHSGDYLTPTAPVSNLLETDPDCIARTTDLHTNATIAGTGYMIGFPSTGEVATQPAFQEGDTGIAREKHDTGRGDDGTDRTGKSTQRRDEGRVPEDGNAEHNGETLRENMILQEEMIEAMQGYVSDGIRNPAQNQNV